MVAAKAVEQGIVKTADSPFVQAAIKLVRGNLELVSDAEVRHQPCRSGHVSPPKGLTYIISSSIMSSGPVFFNPCFPLRLLRSISAASSHTRSRRRPPARQPSPFLRTTSRRSSRPSWQQRTRASWPQQSRGGTTPSRWAAGHLHVHEYCCVYVN